MKSIVIVALLVFVTVAGWRVGEGLSSDATGMAVGILLGVMAGIPTALIVLASGRRGRYDDERRGKRQQYSQLPQQQPPVIVVTGGAAPQNQPPIQNYNQGGYGQLGQDDYYGGGHGTPGGREPRQFRIVGESEEWLDE